MRKATIGDLEAAGQLQIRTGYAHGGHNESGAGVPHVRPFNVDENGSIDLSRIKWVPPPEADSPYWLQPGDVVFNNTNSEDLTGKTAFFDLDVRCTASNHMTILRVAGSELDPYWLAQHLRYLWITGFFRLMLRRYVGQASVSLTRLREVEIDLPAPPEQRAIAHVLRTVQQAREATEQVIAAARELKRSMSRTLITGGIPEMPKTETELGDLPSHWTVRTYAEVGEKPQYGYTTSASDTQSGPRILRITDIDEEAGVEWPSVPYCDTPPEDVSKYLLAEGDLVVARIGATTGKAHYVRTIPPEGAVFASYLIRLRAGSGLEPRYLGHFAQSSVYWSQIDAEKGGKLLKGVNATNLSSMLLPLPPLEEQRTIANSLDALDRKLTVERGRAEALEALFESLLHELMTGRTRVPESLLEAAS